MRLGVEPTSLACPCPALGVALPLPCSALPLPCSATCKDGFAIHMYTCSASMGDSCLANADGDFLIVPQLVGGGWRGTSRARILAWRAAPGGAR